MNLPKDMVIMSSSGPVAKKRKITNGSNINSSAKESDNFKRTANSVKPIIEQPRLIVQSTLPHSLDSSHHQHPQNVVHFDVNDPVKFLQANTPFKCKITNRLTSDDPYNDMQSFIKGYHIEMNAPLHLCSVKFRLDVCEDPDQVRLMKIIATTDHGELTDALDQFTSVDEAPDDLDMTLFVQVINAYWIESMRRAMFFVDCERRYWKLLGRSIPPRLPVAPTLWKDDKKRKRNAIPLFEKVMASVDGDDPSIYGRPELLHKVGGARIRMMTLKHENISLTITWHFDIDQWNPKPTSESDIHAVAIEEFDDAAIADLSFPLLPEFSADLTEARQQQQQPQRTPFNSEDLQAAAVAAGNATIEAITNKKEDKILRPKAGFSPCKRCVQTPKFERAGQEIPTKFDQLYRERGLKYATDEVVKTLFPADTIQDLTLLEMSGTPVFDVNARTADEGANERPAVMSGRQQEQVFEQAAQQLSHQPPDHVSKNVYIPQQQQDFLGTNGIDPRLPLQEQAYSQVTSQEGVMDKRQQDSAYQQYEEHLSSQLQQQMPASLPLTTAQLRGKKQQHVPPQYKPAVPTRYDYQKHGPHQR